MTQTISRMFANKTDADAAVQDLAKHGFGPDEIFVVRPPTTAINTPAAENQGVVDEIADKIARGAVLKTQAVRYAKRVAEGGCLVTVHAPFGSGFKATVLLDRHHPVESGVPARVYPRAKYEEAAPFSSALRLPVLSAEPTPFGAVLGLPSVLLPDGAVLSAWLRYSMVFESPALLSKLLGLPVLTAIGSPTSSVLGLPAVTAKGAPTSLGLPLLTARGAPTSLGLPLLR